MNKERSMDELMQAYNNRAKAGGYFDGRPFWERSQNQQSMLDTPITPEAEERIRQLQAMIEENRAKKEAMVDETLVDTRTDLSNIIDIKPAHGEADAFIEEGVEG